MRATMCLLLSLLTIPRNASAQRLFAPFAGGSAAPAQARPTYHFQVPATSRSVNGGQIAAQLLLGAGGGIVGAASLGLVGAAGRDTWLDADSPGMGGALIGAGLGLVVGTAVGVQVGGIAVGKGGGSFAATLAGTALGTLGFLALASAGLDADYAPFAIAVFALPTIGGVIGYQASVRGRERRASALDHVRVGVIPGTDHAGLAVQVAF